MFRPVRKFRIAALTILVVLVFFLAPVIPYVNSVHVPGTDQGSTSAVWGAATPAYAILGYGPPPYASQELVTHGNRTALVYFEGGKAVAVEAVGGPGMVLNPSNVIAVNYAGVSSSDWGFLNLTFHLQNINYYNITDPVVYVSMVGFSENGTDGSLTIIEPRALGSCGQLWISYDYCTVSQVAPNNLPVNKSFTFYAEVRGTVGGTPFVYRHGFSEAYPRGGIGPQWVTTFMSQINAERGGPPMTENATLDTFAALRFKTATEVFQISDYNLSQDAVAFFGPIPFASQVSELLLFPGVYSPNTYPSFLSQYAPGHLYLLSNTQMTQYGYFVGQAPYYEVSIPCPVYEIPHAGVNITQFFQEHGCTTKVATTTWLVLILSP
ncbi:MAG: hypothetical protein KGI26_06980 [Thaumarchaeota archaeon]|nr:hypothetical protein [Nitrososphaerota archaeon]